MFNWEKKKMKKDLKDSQISSSESWRTQEKGKLPKNEDQPDSLQKLRIAAYVRLSPSGDDREEGSLVSHPQRIEDFIGFKNGQTGGKWGKITGWYIDKDQSGKDLNRPDFQRMCRDIEAGFVDAVVVTELSRLSRKVKDFCHVWDFLKEHNVKFISLKENFDTSTPMGELMLIQAISFAQFERETIVERIRNGSRARAERGLANGCLPLGFDLVPNKANHRKVNEDERIHVQMIFDQMLKLKRMAMVLKFLNDNDYKTKEYITQAGMQKGGKRWTISTLHQVLTNRVYIGQREFNKKNRTKDQKTLKKNDRYFFTDAQWPGIVEEEFFFAVQNLLESNKKRARKYTFPYRLTGLIRCSECGRFLCGKSGTGKGFKYFYYGHLRKMKTGGDDHLKRCHIENIPAPQLEATVLERLQELARDKDLIVKLVDKSHSKDNEKHSTLKSLINSKENQRRKTIVKLNNLIQTIAETSDKIISKILQKRIPELDESKNKLTKEIAKLRSEFAQYKERVIDMAAAFKLLKVFRKDFQNQPPSVQALVLKEIVKEIVVYEDGVELKIFAMGSVDTMVKIHKGEAFTKTSPLSAKGFVPYSGNPTTLDIRPLFVLLPPTLICSE